MTPLGISLMLVAMLACAMPRPHTRVATPTPSSESEDVFGGVAQPGAVPLSLLIVNHGTHDDRLLGANTPVASGVAVHQTRLTDGQRAMQALADGLVIPAGTTIVLEPGEAHVMLVGLRDDLVQGQTFPLTLHFARAGDVTVTVRVRRKLDAAGVPSLPAVSRGALTISLASAPPASPPGP